eukprot:sb/3463605/
MPLTRREVQPVKLAQISHVTSDLSVPKTHNLEETTYISLCGLMKQLGDVATYADEIFTNLYTITKDTCERSERLRQKVNNLNDCLLTGDVDLLSPTGPGPFTKTQKLFVNMSRPKAILDKYKEAEPMPPLAELAEFVVDDQLSQPHGHDFEGYNSDMISLPPPPPHLTDLTDLSLADNLPSPISDHFLTDPDLTDTSLPPPPPLYIPTDNPTTSGSPVDPTTDFQKLYSDPALFINAWLELMEREAQEMRKHRKRSFKKKADGKPKIATLKKKVHDPKTKGFAIVDVSLPVQYETLSVAQSMTSMEPLSATLNRKKYGSRSGTYSTECVVVESKKHYLRINSDKDSTYHINLTPPLTSTSSSNNPGYASLGSPAGPVESDVTPISSPQQSSPRRQCSTPIIAEQPQIQIMSPTDIDLGISGDSLPPPLDDHLPSPPNSPDLPPPIEPPSPPPPPAHEVPQYDFIRPASVSVAQRILKTDVVPETKGRDKLLDMIRSSSFNLRPVQKRPVVEEDQTYATYQGTDVASILQRRKYLMDEDFDSDSSDDGEWD